MVRLRSPWMRHKALRERETYLRARAWHFARNGNFAIAADYVIRLLNRHSRDPGLLLLGEISAQRTRQAQFEAKCREAQQKLCVRKGTTDVFSLVPSDGQREWLHSARTGASTAVVAGAAEVEEHIVVTESEPFSETQSAVRMMTQRASKTPLVELRLPHESVYGRGIYALTAISAGTVVMVDEPFVVQRMVPSACAHCLSDISTTSKEGGAAVGVVLCTHCGVESYCSTGCREAAWREYHSCCCPARNPQYAAWELAMRELLSSDTTEESRAALCCLAVAKLCAISTIQQKHPLSLPCIRSLRGRADYDATTALSQIGAMAVSLAEALHQEHLYMEEILSLFAIIQTNEFLLPGGTALYHGYSFLNHSCEPNCAIAGSSAINRRLVALRNIREGEQLMINYNARLTTCVSYEDRRALCMQRHFECFCPRCVRQE
ncbi:SET domain [Trypanosoma vivax]|uniref:SET domain-containing protein n=1 Tax=Trypanosoma vivax (strain Y486) TaxID=1055687 RepID=G0TZ48_TRYVY|nr:hypothetical protein TRVL_04617 [Trypanosoma vivax]KAH8612962.1 SET domain [Trypanosoma vivax]CCC49251.1 conserved hypothetical protein [Trypanosoma vivax Y486]